VMYAMPVSRAKMMINERTESSKISDTRDQRLHGERLGELRMLVQQRATDVPELIRRAHSKLLCEARGDCPVRAGMQGRGSSAFLQLEATLEIGQTALALVGVRHRQDDFDTRIIRH